MRASNGGIREEFKRRSSDEKDEDKRDGGMEREKVAVGEG